MMMNLFEGRYNPVFLYLVLLSLVIAYIVPSKSSLFIILLLISVHDYYDRCEETNSNSIVQKELIDRSN